MTEEAAPTQETPHSQAWLTSSLSSVAKLKSLAMVLLLVSVTVVMVFVDNNNGDSGNADEIKLASWWL